MLSTHCKNVADKYDIKVVDVKKLISNLLQKSSNVFIFRKETNKNS